MEVLIWKNMCQTQRLPRTILLLHTAENVDDALESLLSVGHVSIKFMRLRIQVGGGDVNTRPYVGLWGLGGGEIQMWLRF